MVGKMPISLASQDEAAEEKSRRAPRGEEEQKAGAAAGPSAKPHTLRDEFGFYRTRGFFPEKQMQQSPRSTLVVPDSKGGMKRSTLYSPMPYK